MNQFTNLLNALIPIWRAAGISDTAINNYISKISSSIRYNATRYMLRTNQDVTLRIQIPGAPLATIPLRNFATGLNTNGNSTPLKPVDILMTFRRDGSYGDVVTNYSDASSTRLGTNPIPTVMLFAFLGNSDTLIMNNALINLANLMSGNSSVRIGIRGGTDDPAVNANNRNQPGWIIGGVPNPNITLRDLLISRAKVLRSRLIQLGVPSTNVVVQQPDAASYGLPSPRALIQELN